MPELRSVACGLRAGRSVSDAEFDRIYPDWARKLSEPHWTPVEVARRAAELLAVDSSSRVLDIGSGVGKFCLIGALTTGVTFVGVEQRANLVDLAQQTARRCGASSVRFLRGDVMTMDWSEFDGFYLYNPFYEHIASFLTPIEEAIELEPAARDRACAAGGRARPIRLSRGIGAAYVSRPVAPCSARSAARSPGAVAQLAGWGAEPSLTPVAEHFIF